MAFKYHTFERTVVFNVYVEGPHTLIPAYEIDKLLDRATEAHTSVCHVPEEITDAEWWFAFDGTTADRDPIAGVRELLDNYNEPPEELPEAGKEEWRRSTVKCRVVVDERK